jgi:hypothetical protein
VGFAVDKVVLGQVLFEYFGFPCQFSLHHFSMLAFAISPTVADIPSGLILTPALILKN